MKKLIPLIFFILSFNNDSFAQDTTNAKFIPMHVGNYYVYNYFVGFNITVTASITKDTIMGGHRYYFFRGFPLIPDGPNLGWMRYDSTTGNLLMRTPGTPCVYNSDIIFDSLNSSIGDVIDCNWGLTTCTETNDSVFSSTHDGLVLRKITYKKGIGIFSACEGEPPPCDAFWTLRGAVVNGVLWGDTTVTNFQQISSNVPNNYKLHQNYPNPFNPATVIKFDIPKSSNAAIIIYDNTGRMVEKLVDGELSPGTYKTVWNASGYASGVYFYRLESGNFTQTRKMLLVR